RHRAFRGDLEKSKLTGGRGMGSSAELPGKIRVKGDYPDQITVFFAEKSRDPFLQRLLVGHITAFLQGDILPDFFIHPMLHPGKLLVGKTREMRKIKTKVIGIDQRSLLLHMGSECLLQYGVQ